MIIENAALYKAVEFDKGILILNALDNMMNRPEARELFMATPKACGEILMKYLQARANGKDQSAALMQALDGQIVTRRGDRT